MALKPGTEQAYTKKLYNIFLGRDPEPGRAEAVAEWLKAAGPKGPEVLAKAILDSDECRRNAITSYYKDLLGREPDEAGLNAWAKSGHNLSVVKAYFCASPEFLSKVDAPPPPPAPEPPLPPLPPL